MSTASPGSPIIQSVARATGILEYIALNSGGETLSNISRGMGLNKSTTYSLIRTLELLGFVHQNQSTGKYTLGLKLFELGQVVHAHMNVRTIAMPFLNELARRYEETVHLAVMSKGEVIYIDKVDGSRSIRIASQVGGRNPAHCTGVGKVLLADLPAAELHKLFHGNKLEQFTPNTITDPQRLLDHLAKVKADGYAFDQEEIEVGLCCVAAPIKNYLGSVVAAISLSGPTSRMDAASLQQIAADITETTRLISTQLGYKNK